MPDKPASYCAPCGAWHEGGCPKTKAGVVIRTRIKADADMG